MNYLALLLVNLFWFPRVIASYSLISDVKTKTSYSLIGDVKDYKREGNTLSFICQNGHVKLSILKGNMIRIHMSPNGVFPKDDLHLNQNGPYAVVSYTWPEVPFTIDEVFDSKMEGDIYKIVTSDNLIIKVRKSPFKLSFQNTNDQLLVMEKEGINNAGLGYEGSMVYETMQLSDDEHFFGFGAFKNPLDMRGKKMVCNTTELGESNIGGGFPVPWFLSTKGYGIFFNNCSDNATFEMGTTKGEYSFCATSGSKEGWDMDYYLIYGPSFQRILSGYHEITGKPMLMEKWLFGHSQSLCYDYQTSDDILAIAKGYRQGDWPCDNILIDDLGLNPNDFSWASNRLKHFADPKALLDSMQKMGFHNCIGTALFRKIYDWSKYDPTKPDVVKDYWKHHIPMVNDGVDFWWQDNGERFYLYSGYHYFANGYNNHELFGSLWAKNVVEGMESLGLYGRPCISRSGPLGGHRYILPWPGDIYCGIDKAVTDLEFVRNGGLSGFPITTVDLGGFVEDLAVISSTDDKFKLEDNNIYRRLINFVFIMPVSREHGCGNGLVFPWDMKKEQQDLYRSFLKLRYRLLPYIYSTAVEAHNPGRPMLASLVFDYQDDPETYTKDYEFMFGREILAAPVLQKDANQWDVYLPEGEWVHYWTGTIYQGKQTITVQAPMKEISGLPLFVKSGSIIPMMPEMNYIYEKQPDPLTLDIYPLKNNNSQFTMFDCSSAKDTIHEMVFSCADNQKSIEIKTGKLYNAYQNSKLELWIHIDKIPQNILINGKQIKNLDILTSYISENEGWYYGDGCFYGSNKMTTLNIKINQPVKDGCKIEIIK